MDPQAGVGGGTPAPKKLRVDSTSMTHPTCNVATTIRVFITPGKYEKPVFLELRPLLLLPTPHSPCF